jgi:putative hydrolase of the HAD superfamily
MSGGGQTLDIVFDFGAVLFTWQPVLLVQRHFGHLTPTAEAAQELAHAVFHHEDWQGFDAGLSELDVVIERTAARLSLPGDALAALLEPIGERLLPIAESVALLEQLAARREARGDVRLFYLSNMPAPYARVLEDTHAFVRRFDGGVFSGDVKYVKPQREIYELLAARHALVPDRTVFIDDLAANVEAAKALGWRGIHCTDTAALAAQLQPLLPA